MAQIQMTRAQAQQYLAQNPNARVVGAMPAQQGGGGFLGGLIGSITKPFTDLGKSAVNTAALIGNMATQRENFDPSLQNFNPVWGSKEEFQSYMQNPLSSGLKTAAGIGAYAVPGAGVFGPGLKGAVASGALSGGLAGFGGSAPGEELSSIGQGALLGGGTGGALYGLSKALPKIGGLGEKLEGKTTGIKAKGSVLGIQEQEALNKDILRITKNQGTRANARGIGEAYNKLSDELGGILGKSSTTANVDDITLEAAKRFALDRGITEDKALQLVEAAMNKNKVAGVLDAQGLASLKRTSQPFAMKANLAMERGGSTGLTTEAQKYVNEVSDELLKGGMNKRGLQIYTDMAKLHQAAPDMIAKATKGQSITSPLLLGGLKIPTGGIPQAAQAGLGQGLQRIGELNIPQQVTQYAPVLAGQMGATTQQDLLNQQDQGMGGGITPGRTELLGRAQTGPSAEEKRQYFMSLLGKGYSPNEAVTIMENTGYGTAKAPSAATQKTQMQAVSGMQALGDIATLLQQDPSILKKQHLPGVLEGTGTKQFNNAVNVAAEMFGRLQSGGAINKQEESRFKAMLPSTWDDDATIAYKLSTLNQYFAQLSNTQASPYDQTQLLGNY